MATFRGEDASFACVECVLGLKESDGIGIFAWAVYCACWWVDDM